MKKGEEITQTEVREIQLGMLDEIDAFCRKKGLRYSLAFGTLLGAIRHKGYIPWDDDMDIIMPLPDMIEFKKSFNSKNLQYIDIDTTKHFEFHFSRISHNQSYSKPGLTTKSYGVNIDLYPVVGMPDTEEEIQDFLKSIKPLYDKRINYMKWKRRITSRLPVSTIYNFDNVIRQFHDIILNSFPYQGAKNFLHAGSVRRVNIFEFDVFEDQMDVDFEGRRYMGIKRYHEYLTHCYGDYMQLPPENERVPYHDTTFYWK